MALSRRNNRMNTNIWPGFVDAMTGLLLVLMFVLTIFTVLQFALRETISGQETQLDDLAGQVAALTGALGLAESARDALSADLAEADAQITGFEAQVAGLLAERADLTGQVAGLEQDNADLLTAQQQLDLALATARSEIDAQSEAARLAAARREALEALVADLRDSDAAQSAQISELEAARLVDAAAAEALRARLADADAELTAMTLSLEEQRRAAEETLTLLAAAEAARDGLAADLSAQAATATEAERQAALLAVAEQALAAQEAQSTEAQRQTALLNEQVAALRAQVGSLQSLLNIAESDSAAANVQIEALGSQLNTALARVAAEESRRAELEEAERIRLEEETARLQAEAQDLERFRSDFFGQLRGVVEGLDGVQIVGDRFIFSSEVLFGAGDAQLSAAGQADIAQVAGILRQIADQIPDGIDWIIRVDGHTDDQPLSGFGAYADNWELSQARALSVVRYMETLGIPPQRMSANGFAEFQPLNPGTSAEARAQNRRIELKLTER